MAINVEALLNWPFEDVIQPYTAKDTMLYALGLNAVLFAAGVIAFLALLAGARRSGALMQTGE